MSSAAQSKTGSPHQQRREQVYAVLSQAPAGATYSQLVELVRSQTGKGCSRKLISQWKRESGQADKSTDGRGQVHGQVDGRDPISANTVDGRDRINPKSPNVVPFKRPLLPKRRQTATNGRGSAPVPAPIQNPKSKIQNRRKSPNLIALAALSIGLALGCGWLLFDDDLPRLDKLELLAIAQEPRRGSAPVPAQAEPNPKSKIQNPKSIPKSLKITLNVTKPEHIKV